MKEKVNVYQMVTDRVIEQLEKGDHPLAEALVGCWSFGWRCNQLCISETLFTPESDAFRQGG